MSLSHLAAPAPRGPSDNPSNIGDRITGPLNITVFPLSRTFHPILRLSIRPSASSPPPSSLGCYALISLSLSDEVFIDRDELGDRWDIRESPLKPFDPLGEAGPSRPKRDDTTSIRSKTVPALRAWILKPGIIDIERPVRTERVYIRNTAGEEVEEVTRLSVALELRTDEVVLDVPLHGRYLDPRGGGGGKKAEREVIVFGEGGGELRGGWMCAMSEDPERIFAQRPKIPPPNHAHPDSPGRFCFNITVPPLPLLHSPTAPMTLTLPTGTASHQLPVEIITALAVWLGWAYLVRKIWRFSVRVKKHSGPGRDRTASALEPIAGRGRDGDIVQEARTKKE